MQELGLDPALAKTWFNVVQNAPFMLVQVDEATAATLPALLTVAVRRSFVTDTKIAEAIASNGLTEAAAIAAKLPDPGSVMAGDFGEILTYVLHAALCHPETAFGPKKWRLKQERNQPAPKSDVVHFVLPSWPTASAQDVLLCSEVKVKSTAGASEPIKNAIKDCAKDRKSRLVATLVWLKERALFEPLGAIDIAQLDRFLKPDEHPPHTKKFYAVAVISANFVGDELRDAPPEQPTDYDVVVVSLPQLKTCYEAAFVAAKASTVATPAGGA